VRKVHPLFITMLIAALPMSPQAVGGSAGGMEAAMQLSSPDIVPGAEIPKAFTADGADFSPALVWHGAPGGTRAFALIVDDPDAPAGLWVHWVAFDMPVTVTGLAQGQARDGNLSAGGRQGRNSWSRLGWNGPSPPPGRPHRYFFKLYALSSPLGLAPGATAQAVTAAMKGKILAETSLMGTYGR
jgi:hypothetical protein